MKLLNTFFGQILRKGDVDFQNKGAREGIVETNIDLTSKLGGVINGLNVFKSIDNLSVLITPGTFYSSGEFSDTNNVGGGERAQIFTTQSFTGLPQTPPIANQPSYLLIYVKVTTVNNNPNPTKLQTIATSKNIQTGENVPTRQYPVGSIVISNPVLRSEINKFNGVPLALLQVDYSGTVQVSSNATIQTIDTSVKRDYIIGGAINVATQKLIPQAIPDGFITTSMIGDGQISGAKFLSGSINSSAIAAYDGSENIATTGNGIATDHLKTGAVTSEKLGFNNSLNEFNGRNFLLNSSFELSPASLTSWNFTGETGTSASVETNQATTLFGLRSAKLVGAASVGVPKSLKISQMVDFGGPINGQPISAYFYARPISDFNLAESGTTGITGRLDFYNNASDVTPVSGMTFDAYSGTADGSFIKLETDAPIVISENETKISAITFSISGIFSNTVNVDGAFLGLSSQSPKFDIAVGEQVGTSLNASNITLGQLDGSRIADGAIVTSKIRGSGGGVIVDSGFGIRGDQIRNQTITADNIAPGTITNAQLSAGIAAIPDGAVLIFLTRDSSTLSDPIAQGCPSGFRYLPDFEGRFILGANPSATTAIVNPNVKSTSKVPGSSVQDGRLGVLSVGESSHVHSVNIGGADVGGGSTSRAFPGNYTSSAGTNHAHEEVVPYITAIFCQKV